MMRKLKSIFRANQHRMLALMLTFCMLISIVPNMGIAALEAGKTATSVIVGDATLSSDRPYLVNGAASASGTPGADGCTAYFDANSGTITLNGANITKEATGYTGGISANGDLILTLEGDNKITVTGNGEWARGIYLNPGKLTIQGNGKLTINAYSDGIYVYGGNLNIADGMVHSTATGMNNGICAISDGGIDINGGTVIAEGPGAGIYGEQFLAISGNADVTGISATGYGLQGGAGGSDLTPDNFSISGNAVAIGQSDAEGRAIKEVTSHINHTIWAGNSEADAEEILAFPDSNTYKYIKLVSTTPKALYYDPTDSKLHYADIDMGNFEIKPGAVYTEQTDKWTGNGNTLTLNGFFYATDSDQTQAALLMPDGTELVLEGENTIKNKNVYAVQGLGVLKIKGNGTLNAGGATHGIYDGNKSLTIEGNCTINASGSTCGIYCGAGTLTINGGTINVPAANEDGIYGKTVRVTGGTIHAAGTNTGIRTWDNLAIDGGTVEAFGNIAALQCTQGTISIANGMDIRAGDDAANANDITYENQKYVKIASPLHTHCICGGTMSDHTGHGEAVTYQPLDSSFTGGTLSNGNYYLDEDITLTSNLTVDGFLGKESNLCLNGHVLNLAGHKIIKDSSGGLNICDCTNVVTKGYVDDNGLWHWDSDGSYSGEKEYNLTGGVITGGFNTLTTTSSIGGAIQIGSSNAVLNFYSGNTAGNKTNKYGGAVGITAGKFNMYGGSIVGNTAVNENTGGFGAGIAIFDGELDLYGGSIADNNAIYGGGGVYLGYTSGKTPTFNMSGGSITNNIGGGVYSASSANSVISMSGGIVKGNTQGGGFYIDNCNSLTLSGGEITGNMSTMSSGFGAGGIYYNHGQSFKVSGNPVVKDNTLKGTASNIYICKTALNNPFTITIDGPMTEGASLGVSKKETPETGVNVDVTGAYTTANYSKYFFSDNPDHYIVYNAGKVQLSTEQPHTHCVCGGTTVSGDHTGESHEDIDYQPWDGSTTNLPAGNYYLKNNITMAQAITTTGTVNLCLNGYNITFTTNEGQILPGSDSTLNICDCAADQGTISVPSDSPKNTIYFKNVDNATVKIYGGTIVGSTKTNTVTDSDETHSGLCESCAFYLYGGTVKNDSKAAVGNVQSKVYLYGGTVNSPGNNGVATRAAGIIYLCGNTVINHGEGFASVKSLGEGCIDAKGYTGAPLTISYEKTNPADSEVVVKNSTNTTTFTLIKPDGKKLQALGDNLVLASKEYTITLPGTQTGYTLAATTGSASPVTHGGSFTFQFALADGYSKTDNFAVKVNGTAVTLNANGSYTISDITTDTTVTVEGVADTTVPTGEITIGTNKWRTFLNNITFGLFFKDTQSVTVTATDPGSGIDKIYYYLADSAKTEDELKAFTGWTEYTASFNIAPNNKYVIYAKLVDKAGNTAYINTDGLVLDSIAPVISGIENGKTYCEAQSFTVTEENLNQVTVNGTAVSAVNGTYTVSPEKGEQTVVVTDKAGNSVTYKVTVNDGHTLSYAANENVVTETCGYCSHNATATITATSAVYAGSPLETAGVAYSAGWEGGTLAISYVNNNGVGEATASITKNGATASIKFNITAGSQTAPAGIGKTDETIDGKADGSLTGVNNTMEYRKDGETDYTPITGTTVGNLEDGTYYVRFAGNDNYNASPDSAAIVIAAGGKLNVTFKVDGATLETKQVSWNGKIDTLPQIPSKTGYDQTAPTWDKSLAELQKIQADVIVTAQYTINTYAVTLASGSGYTLTAVGSSSPVNHNGSYTFKLTVAEGYSQTDDFNVLINDAIVNLAADGTYTILNITGPTEVTVAGVADITAPEIVTVSYGRDSFKEFLNTITFGLLFDDTVTVELTASDAGSGVKAFKYRLGNGEEQTIAAENGSATFSITSEFIGNINGVKAVDNDGNESEAKAYEYFAIDKSNPTKPTVTTSYTSGEWTTNDVTFTVSGSTATSGIVKYQYSTDDGANWTDMEATSQTADGEDGKPANVTEATRTVSETTDGVSYIFRAVSGVGKESSASEATVVKIDKGTPTIGVSCDNHTVAQSDVITITTDAGVSGVAKVEVSKDNGEWAEVTETTYTVTANGTYTFKLTNGAGITVTQVIIYENIDTQKPALTIDSGDYTEGNWSQKNIALSITNTTENLGTTRFEYKVGNGEWTTYIDPVVVSEDTTGTTYTFRATSQAGITSDEVSITVKKDGTNPDGDITIKGNSVKQFINAITFGLFFNEDVDVTITAEDATSGIASIQYFRSESILTEEAVKALTDWTDYTSISEAAADAGKFVYYVKLTDNAGNITYFGSDGVILDTTAPDASGVTDGETYYTTHIVALEDENLESVTLNGEAVTGPITLEGNKEATYTIVATDKAGNETTVVITMKPIASISDSIDDLTVDTVKSTDKDAIEAVKEAAEAVGIENATQEEKNALQEIIDQCEELLNRVEETQNVLEENKDRAEAIDPDKATSDDRDSIKDLLDEIEQIIGSDNLTDSEKAEQQQLKDQLEDILEELDKVSDIIGEAGKDADGINEDSVKPEDKAELENAKKELEDVLKEHGDHMTDAEKGTVQSKIDAIDAMLSQLDKTTAPETGDDSNMMLWIALLFVSCGGVITTTVYGKSRKADR